MDDFFAQYIEMQVLDFATEKRHLWEQNHQLYSVIFEITPRCNFSCIHCYMHGHHCSKELSREEIIDIIDILYAKEVLFLTFTGGEIFTRKDFVDIYLYAKRKGFIIELYTNGMLINEELLQVFKEYPPLLIDISLYGSCSETYERVTGVADAFETVLHNIEALIALGIRVSLKAPVLNVYLNELDEMKAISDSLGVPFRTGFEVFPTIDNENYVQQYSVPAEDALRYEFANSPQKPRAFGGESEAETVDLKTVRPLFRCKLGRASCVISFEGKLCPCMSFRHAGQAFTMETFDDVWKSFAQYPKMKASATYKCLCCKAYNYCDICPALMQFVHGELEYIDEHFCKIANARYAYYEMGASIEEATAIAR